LKPFQAAASIKAGAVDSAGFTETELALMCASHQGENIHVETAKSMMKKLDYSVDKYECGAHYPADRESRYSEIRAEKAPVTFQNNCSGKHTGMLALAKHLKVDSKGYINRNHPVQEYIFSLLKSYLNMDEIPFSVDGCSAPTPFLTLQSIASLFQKMGSGEYPELNRAYQAMTNNPYLIAGKNQFDTNFIAALNGRGIAKGGGEAVQGISIQRSDNENWGIALKVLDGNPRSIPIAVMHILGKYDLLTKKELKKLDRYRSKTLKNVRGTDIGKIEIMIEDN
jgi:L-asparaginase II